MVKNGTTQPTIKESMLVIHSIQGNTHSAPIAPLADGTHYRYPFKGG
jgi:hypothetical protein